MKRNQITYVVAQLLVYAAAAIALCIAFWAAVECGKILFQNPFYWSDIKEARYNTLFNYTGAIIGGFIGGMGTLIAAIIAWSTVQFQIKNSKEIAEKTIKDKKIIRLEDEYNDITMAIAFSKEIVKSINSMNFTFLEERKGIRPRDFPNAPWLSNIYDDPVTAHVLQKTPVTCREKVWTSARKAEFLGKVLTSRDTEFNYMRYKDPIEARDEALSAAQVAIESLETFLYENERKRMIIAHAPASR